MELKKLRNGHVANKHDGEHPLTKLKDKSADLLQATLDEESEANELLNKLAEDIVNPEALMEPELVGASSER